MRKAGPWLLKQANEVLVDTHAQLSSHPPLKFGGRGSAQMMVLAVNAHRKGWLAGFVRPSDSAGFGRSDDGAGRIEEWVSANHGGIHED